MAFLSLKVYLHDYIIYIYFYIVVKVPWRQLYYVSDAFCFFYSIIGKLVPVLFYLTCRD